MAARAVVNWSAKTGPALARAHFTRILENPYATVDDVLRGPTAVKGFLGSIGDADVILWISKETGRLVTAHVVSPQQFMKLFLD